MQNGPISLVAPVAASGVVVPVAGGLLLGEQVSRAACVGLVLIAVGVMIVARSHAGPTAGVDTTGGGLETLATPPGRSQVTAVHDNCKRFAFAHPHRAAVVLAGTSAAAFGVFYIILRQAAAAAHSAPESTEAASTSPYPVEAAVLVALAVQTGSLLFTLASASRHTLRCVTPTRRLITYALTIGLLDVGGDVMLAYAIAVGPIALVGPLGSLDPIIAVMLASVFFGEPVTPRRAVGLAACVAGIALVAV